MTDIVERLREREADLTGCVFDDDAKIFGRAADEIERLRRRIEQLEFVIAYKDRRPDEP